jgi:hypothetical protein
MQDPNNLTVYRRALDYAVRCTRLTRRIRTREAPEMVEEGQQIRRTLFALREHYLRRANPPLSSPPSIPPT